jgi:hypothetical protein
MENSGIICTETDVVAGGIKSPKLYKITKDACNFTKTEKFIKIAESIFSPPKDSLSERVSQGLGWMTKGRQAFDKSEKFLFFFTAIEALLSSDDAPITQTISRHAATILSKEIKGRYKIAEKIKRLYALRSTLVHTGKKSVSMMDVIEIQFYAESLFYEVLELDISMKFKDFQTHLTQASYGTEWPVS